MNMGIITEYKSIGDKRNNINDLIIINNKLEELESNFDFVKNKIILNEDELSQIFGIGYSVSTLSNLRKNGRAISEYIQLSDKCRILYPLLNIVEQLTNIKLENHEMFYAKRIKEIIKYKQTINANQISKMFNISPSTLKSYIDTGLFMTPNFQRKKWTIDCVAKFIVENQIKSAA
ncbi:MAG: hypothetical protein U9N59_06850 [Campylobacterota bacterium]|nr:hypothetical protein [Campylobacterota bacterium]